MTGIYGYDKALQSDSFAKVAGATYRVSFDWVADGASARISFLGRANGADSHDAGIGLDDVRVERLEPVLPRVTAEPGTWALMLAGLAATARRRRRD